MNSFSNFAVQKLPDLFYNRHTKILKFLSMQKQERYGYS